MIVNVLRLLFRASPHVQLDDAPSTSKGQKWADSKGAEVRLRTSLAGGAIAGVVPSGNADFRSESDRNRSRLNVEVEHVNLPDGTVLGVLVSHAGTSMKVGEIRLQGGFGEL